MEATKTSPRRINSLKNQSKGNISSSSTSSINGSIKSSSTSYIKSSSTSSINNSKSSSTPRKIAPAQKPLKKVKIEDRLGKTVAERLGKTVFERLGKPAAKGSIILGSGKILGPRVTAAAKIGKKK